MKSWQIGAIVAVVAIAVFAGAAYLIVGGSGKAAATVNGVVIPESEVEQQLAAIKEQQKNLFEGPNAEENEKRYREQIIDFLVNTELINQEAKRVGIKVTDKEVNDRLDQLKSLFNDEAAFKKALKDEGLTEEELKEKIREQIVADKMMERIRKDVKVTKKEKKDYFKENKEQFIEPKQLELLQIVSKNKDDAEAIKEELDGGADFEELAKEKSVDEESAKKGGDIGFVRATDFPTEIGSQLEKLDVDEVSDVIKSSDSGFMIFKLKSVKEEKQMEYDDVEDQIEQIIVSNKQQEEYSKLMERLKKEATIKKNID